LIETMSRYSSAREAYAQFGVDTEVALLALADTPISLHCWQGDDVAGFEQTGSGLSGGIQASGNYPGRARTIEELRSDLEQAVKLIPGKKRLNLHACYADLGGRKVERNAYSVREFQSWIDWCKAQRMGMDFNPTYFSHPLAAEGFTLSHRDGGIRQYWIEHGIACRQIAAEIGKQLGNACVTNFWIPDGYKDLPFDRKSPRLRLEQSLDAIFKQPIDPKLNLDAVESKLFGLGVESYTVGSHEFYLGYAVSRQKLYCLDAGHFHPTEQLGDKISSVLQFTPELLLHVSRGVRWDSDHVVIDDDATRGIMQEVVRGGFLSRTHIGLDFFDASINRVAAWTIGTRSALKCLLQALLEPASQLRDAEQSGDHTARLALMEEAKSMPFGDVWDEFCRRQEAPVGTAWLQEVRRYESEVLSKRV
jgi:L-rhamnose isomerase